MDTVSDSTSRGNGDITAVIACFNYGQYLVEAVDSALAEGAKVIVVDDGSTEPLPELPPEVELIRQQNRGVAHARNAGLARVETPYALVLDADDRLAPGALATLRAPLEADPTPRVRLRAHALLRRLGGRDGLSSVRPLRAPLPAHDRA